MSIMLLHTAELVSLSNRVTRAKTSRGAMPGHTGRETTRKIETTSRGKPAKLQYRSPKPRQRVTVLCHVGGTPWSEMAPFGNQPLLSLLYTIAIFSGHCSSVVIESVLL